MPHLEPDKTLRVVPPNMDRDKLFHEAHDGRFGGHLRYAKIHGQLGRHYWWPGMRRDIRDRCRTGDSRVTQRCYCSRRAYSAIQVQNGQESNVDFHQHSVEYLQMQEYLRFYPPRYISNKLNTSYSFLA